MNPKYPIYVISKGRADSRMTSKVLEQMDVPYFIVVEPQEKAEYEAVISPDKVLVLPIGNHGMGSGLARNWCWEHSRLIGAERHWLMDDNIKGLYRWNNNRQIMCETASIFRAMEDFVDRYENIQLAGPQYFMFVPRKIKMPPYVPNTRIYSCILIQNDIPYRWRSKYNEDVDLSLRVLKGGGCTVQFNAFLQWKMPTQMVAGGNNTEVYKSGTLDKSKLLVSLHPDVARVTWKFNRWHHEVDYGPFKRNKFIKKPGLVIPDSNDEYGMTIVEIEKEEGEQPEEAPVEQRRFPSMPPPRR